MPGIPENLQDLKVQIEAQLGKLGRAKDDYLLVAVSKTHPAPVVWEAVAAGATDIGENKVQEALEKIPLIREMGEPQPAFHFIGHLQKNKVKPLLGLEPSLIHSVDSFALAERISRLQMELNPHRTQDILVQINCSGEDSKSGMEPEGAIQEILKMRELEGIRVLGLMTIGLLSEDPADAAPGFRRLKAIYDELKAYEDNKLIMKWLSMGMTDDWKIALAEGSNLLRIGSAIFGRRNYGVD